MEALELKKRVLNIKFDGNDYSIEYPSVKRINNSKNLLESGTLDGVVDFISMLGLPKEVLLEMEAQHIEAILEELVKKKK